MRLNVKETRRVADVCLFAKGLNRYNSSHISLFRMLNKPFAIAVANFLTHRKLRLSQELLFDDNQYLRNEVIELTGQELIGSSTGLHQVTQMIRHVAPLDSPVLLTGETGVGKEVVANAIQQNSNRREKPFVKVNCGCHTTVIDRQRILWPRKKELSPVPQIFDEVVLNWRMVARFFWMR